jgi:two-component system CitB family sensor kinase
VHRRLRLATQSLATQILLLQVVMLLVTIGIGAAVVLHQGRQQLEGEYARRMRATAEQVAAAPIVRDAFPLPDPARVIQPVAESARLSSGASYVWVLDRNLTRLSDPDPRFIGTRVERNLQPALQGRAFTSVESTTRGRVVEARVPILSARGEVIGVVAAGTFQRDIPGAFDAALPVLLAYVGLVFPIGLAGSYLLARRVKRQTFGLEPREIAGLLEHREATLHGIREGIVAVDTDHRVTLVNDEARRLLELPADCAGRHVDELPLNDRLRDVITGVETGSDQIVLRHGRILVFNRRPVAVHDDTVGAVVTFRDRTELDRLARELEGARSTTDALRAQAHEFSNRMHTVAGLLELEEYEAAGRFIAQITEARERLAETLTTRIGEPAVAALLLAKAAAAAERGAELRVAEDSSLPACSDLDARDLVTVVGNFVDNALEAVGPAGGWVEVCIRDTAEGILVRVRDSGPGVAPELADEVFRHGFTTKVATSGGQRGLGLALTRQACLRRGGWTRVSTEEGAVFSALLPPVAGRAG